MEAKDPEKSSVLSSLKSSIFGGVIILSHTSIFHSNSMSMTWQVASVTPDALQLGQVQPDQINTVPREQRRMHKSV